VGSSQTHTEFDFDNDPRLATALGPLLEQTAERLGMSDDSLRKLEAAAREAWKNCWQQLNSSGEKLHLECEEYEDRIELTFRCAGNSGSSMEACAKELKAKVDDVSFEKASGKPQLKLTAYANRR